MKQRDPAVAAGAAVCLCELERAGRRAEHVGGLDVPVGHANLVQVEKRGEQLAREALRLRLGHEVLRLRQPVEERAARAQLAAQRHVLRQVVDAEKADARRVADEAPHADLLVGRARRLRLVDHLDRDALARTLVGPAHHRTKCALTQWPVDAVQLEEAVLGELELLKGPLSLPRHAGAVDVITRAASSDPRSGRLLQRHTEFGRGVLNVYLLRRLRVSGLRGRPGALRVIRQALTQHEAREQVQQQAGRADEVGQQHRVRGEDPPPPAVEPDVAADEEVPDEHVRPLLGGEVAVRAQLEVGLQAVLIRVEELVEQIERRGDIGCTWPG